METQWIPFSERQPPEKGRYLVYHWYMDAIEISYWNGEHWEYKNSMTHWVHLPQKPTASTSTALEMGIAIEMPR